jgi:uncharacterized membrane protein
MTYIIYFIATLIPMMVLDAIWILGLAKNFYATHMGFLFSKSINLVPAGFFYPLYALGILMLVVIPAIKSGSWTEALLRQHREVQGQLLWQCFLATFINYNRYDGRS